MRCALGDVSTLVLDEADGLLHLGFADELAAVIARLPPGRQNLLFSATFPPDGSVLAEQLLHDLVRIDVPATVETQPAIHQRSIKVAPARRTQLLTMRSTVVRGLKTRELERVINYAPAAKHDAAPPVHPLSLPLQLLHNRTRDPACRAHLCNNVKRNPN
jgi:hypothetical protein